MSITVHFPRSTEERLRAQAATMGKGVGELIVEAVDAHLSLAQTCLRTILAPVHEDYRNSGMTEFDLNSFLEDAIAESRSARQSERRTGA